MSPEIKSASVVKNIITSFHIEDLALFFFFILIEPLIGTYIPHSNLNNPHPGVPGATSIAFTCFAAGLLACLCAATRVTVNNKTITDVDNKNFLSRFFVVIYGTIVMQIGTEYLEATSHISSLLGMLLLMIGMAYYFLVIVKNAARLPGIPYILRRILIIPFLLYISYMMEAIFEPAGIATFPEILLTFILSLIMFAMIILPVRRFSECEAFTVFPWTVRFILFTAGIYSNMAIGKI